MANVDISSSWLTQLGVKASEKELKELAEIAMDELEVRVGYEIAEHLTKAQITEFEALLDTDDDDAKFDWLEQAMPDYKKVVKQKYSEMAKQIEKSSDKVGFIKSWQD